MNVEKFDFIIGDRASGHRACELNKLVHKLDRLTTDYKNGWLSYKQYQIQVKTITDEIKKLKEGN